MATMAFVGNQSLLLSVGGTSSITFQGPTRSSSTIIIGPHGCENGAFAEIRVPELQALQGHFLFTSMHRAQGGKVSLSWFYVPFYKNTFSHIEDCYTCVSIV